MTELATESGSQPEATAVAAVEGESAPPASPSEKPDPNVTASGERLDRQTRNWRALERDRDHWREMALRTSQQPQESPPAKDTPKTLADFGFDEEKFATHLRQVASEDARRAAREELEQERKRTTEEQRETAFRSRETAFAKDKPDYFEVTRDESLPITSTMAEAIKESDEGPALVYHLATNLALAESISRMSPAKQALAMGKIEAQLESDRKAALDAKKRVSNAPPPPPKLEAVEASVEKDPSQMSDAEFAKWRRRQIAQRR